MLRIKKIIYIFGDKKEFEKTDILTFVSKEQLEIYRQFLISKKRAQNVYFQYEEH